MINPTIELFFKCYLQWVAMDHPETKTFINRYGLCGNLSRFSGRINIESRERSMLLTDLNNMFRRDHMDKHFPFNEGSQTLFQREMYSGNGHINAMRLAWVEKQIPDFKPDGLMNGFIGWLSSYRSGYENSNIRWEDIRRLSLDDGSIVRAEFRGHYLR